MLSSEFGCERGCSCVSEAHELVVGNAQGALQCCDGRARAGWCHVRGTDECMPACMCAARRRFFLHAGRPAHVLRVRDREAPARMVSGLPRHVQVCVSPCRVTTRGCLTCDTPQRRPVWAYAGAGTFLHGAAHLALVTGAFSGVRLEEQVYCVHRRVGESGRRRGRWFVRGGGGGGGGLCMRHS